MDPRDRIRDADHRDGRLAVALPRRRPTGFGLRAAQSAALTGEREPPATQPPSRRLPGVSGEGARRTTGRPRPLQAATGRARRQDAETELPACNEPRDALHRAAEFCLRAREPGLRSWFPTSLALVTLCNAPHAFTHNPCRGGDAPARVLPLRPVADTETVWLLPA